MYHRKQEQEQKPGHHFLGYAHGTEPYFIFLPNIFSWLPQRQASKGELEGFHGQYLAHGLRPGVEFTRQYNLHSYILRETGSLNKQDRQWNGEEKLCKFSLLFFSVPTYQTVYIKISAAGKLSNTTHHLNLLLNP